MDKTGSAQSPQKEKKRTNGLLGLFVVVLLIGISVGLYLLGNPTAFTPRAATDTFSKCGPSGHCNDYDWNNNSGYTTVPTNCYVALYKCDISQWNKALQVGCQKNTSDPSKNTAYYAEIHKLSVSNPNPKIWDKVVAGADGNGHLKPFAPPQFCGLWQIDVGPPCNFSYHSGGDRRDAICKAPQSHNVCDGMACKKVSGPGQNECSNPGNSPAPQCTHKECKNNQCVLVAGGKADNKCQIDSDCQPGVTPTLTPTPIPSLSKTPTPTPPSCPVPSPVSNLKITCPLCSQSK